MVSLTHEDRASGIGDCRATARDATKRQTQTGLLAYARRRRSGLACRPQTAVDGDTIKLKGTTSQLYGIDAAEKEQACADGWAAGRAAIIHLRDLTQDGEVACEAVATDRFGPGLAVCTVEGEDPGASMVAAGMAWAFTRHASDYIDEEAQANIDRLDVHSHGCVRAWDWRALQRRR